MVDGEATLLLDGADVENLTECVEGPVVWPYAGRTQRGSLPQFPGRDGALYISQPYSADVLPLEVTLRSPACSGGSGQAMQEALDALRVACRPDRQVTLRRLWPDADYDEALAKFLNITPQRPVKNVMRCLVEFTLLELWYGPSVSGIGAGTHNILGTTRTRRLIITLPAGAARTITNTTNGHWLTFGATVPSGGVEIDVEARTAFAVSGGGTDMSADLSWGKFYPMQLDPGSNVITVSASTASIAYQPAYL